jgi:2,3-bisphosphoglycerate-independent phosphoglycerate mutase
MRYIQIVLDGLGDIGRTPLMLAKKPNIDKLSKSGTVGLYKIKYGDHVNSDVGYLALLSYHQRENYPGRGYLEALGINLAPREKDICIRGNFATIDENRVVVDRRAGRDETGLNAMCKKLDGIRIDGIKFLVKKSESHRVVIIMRGKHLSKELWPNDHEKTGIKLIPIKAKNRNAEFSASVINKFIEKMEKQLSQDPINKKRKIPANTVLIRNFGQKKTAIPFRKRFGLRACCIAGVPIAKGVANFLGMDVINTRGVTGLVNTNLDKEFAALRENFHKYDFIFFHINATDILSHDAEKDKKIKYIEKLDKYIGNMMKQMDMKNTRIVITCDHRTASDPEYKKYRHLNMPVPFLIAGAGIKSMGMDFDEKTCEKGIKLKENTFVQMFTR